MTLTIRTTRTQRLARTLGLAALLAGALASGCKSKDKDGGVARGSGGGGRSDPLLAGPGRIAPQNLPVPEKNGTAGGRRSDPLLGSPTGRRGEERSGYTDDPDRFKRPHVPSAGSVPAALAGRTKDDEGLKIERPGGPDPVQPAGGVMPPASIPNGGGLPDEAKLIELETIGVKRGDSSLERDANGGYTCRARVPINQDGAVRQYSGTGATTTEAIAEVVKNIKSDRGK